MSVYEFIFSEKRKNKIARHLAFWGICSIGLLYRHISHINEPRDFLTLRPYIFAFINLLLWLPLSVLIVSLFAEILIPRFLQKKKYVTFITAAIFICFCDLLVSYLLATFYMDHVFNIEAGEPADANFRPHAIVMLTLLHTLMIDMGLSFLASGIKIAKILSLQQVENTRLAKERSENETRIAKGRIQPAFLLQSLASVYSKVSKMEPDAPQQILQLSDLLSYILYDSNENLVLLKKELEMTRSMIDMEKIKYENQFELLLQTSGDIENKSIRPLTLFSQIQQILQISPVQKGASNIATIIIAIEDDFISIRLPDNLLNQDNHEMYAVEGFNMKNRAALYNIPEKEMKISIVKTNIV